MLFEEEFFVVEPGREEEEFFVAQEEEEFFVVQEEQHDEQEEEEFFVIQEEPPQEEKPKQHEESQETSTPDEERINIYYNQVLQLWIIANTNVVFSMHLGMVVGLLHHNTVIRAPLPEVVRVCEQYDIPYWGDVCKKVTEK
jgi:hypothetical protein